MYFSSYFPLCTMFNVAYIHRVNYTYACSTVRVQVPSIVTNFLILRLRKLNEGIDETLDDLVGLLSRHLDDAE